MDITSGLKNPKKRQLGAKFDKTKNRYLSSTAGPSRKERYNILLHRLVWICANGEIPDEINHKNGIKWDNRLDNLELATKSTNALHSYRVLGNKGGVSVGEKSGVSKLTWEKVNKMRDLWERERIPHKMLGEIFGVSKYTVIDVLRWRTWRYMETKRL
jgi:hypothetical protein